MGYEGDDDINSNWCIWVDIQRFGKEAGSVGNQIQATAFLRSARILRRFLVT